MININKIVIVGGGSSGWMSAATMIRKFPKKEIVVIESPDYPIIGVGESTIGAIRAWTSWIGIDEKDFIPSTDATYKISIKFRDFYKKNDDGFHYPFGTPFLDGTKYGLNDWYIKKAKYTETKVDDYARTFFPAITLAEKNKISDNSLNLGNFDFYRDTAFHFDATKFGQWLKNNYCLPRGVKLINESVIEVKTNKDGVESLILSNGEIIKSDLFIDCTGFKSMLLGKALNEPWEDFSHILPNNNAWATRIPYTNKEKEMEPFTNCTAIENGWVWNTPTWERIGTGYVFSDKYVTPEDALKEFKKYLCSDKMTVHDPNRDVESFNYRLVKFKTGIHKNTFVKNVVAIGLSAGFIEPLESNGLYTVHEFLLKLVRTLGRETINQWDRDAYNANTKFQYMTFKEFVEQHYALSNREDTKYWRDVTERQFQPKVPNLEPHISIGFNVLSDIQINSKRHDMFSGLHCIATGLNYFPVDKDVIDMWSNYDKNNYYDEIESTISNWKYYSSIWEEEADKSKTMYQWLKDNMYNDKD
jgi:tryptophan halogenase